MLPPNAKGFPLHDYRKCAEKIFTDFSTIGASSPDKVLFNSYASAHSYASAQLTQGRPSLISELSAINLTLDELNQIVLLENDPDVAELLGSWFDSRRQVALTIAGGCLAGAIAAFIGDATVVGTAHGIFSGAYETSAVISLSALTGACVAGGTYYLNKVRKIANKSLRTQHVINRRRR
jgi:hypothetical protein